MTNDLNEKRFVPVNWAVSFHGKGQNRTLSDGTNIITMEEDGNGGYELTWLLGRKIRGIDYAEDFEEAVAAIKNWIYNHIQM